MYQRNAKVTQHDTDFENNAVGDDEEHLEAPHCPILDINVAKNNACISQSENVLEVHTRSRPRSLFSPLDSNCPKQQRIFNCWDQIDLQTLECVQELYTCPRGININKMLLISQLI